MSEPGLYTHLYTQLRHCGELRALSDRPMHPVAIAQRAV